MRDTREIYIIYMHEIVEMKLLNKRTCVPGQGKAWGGTLRKQRQLDLCELKAWSISNSRTAGTGW